MRKQIIFRIFFQLQENGVAIGVNKSSMIYRRGSRISVRGDAQYKKLRPPGAPYGCAIEKTRFRGGAPKRPLDPPQIYTYTYNLA